MEGTFHSLSFLDIYQKLPNFFVGENQVNWAKLIKTYKTCS